MNILSPGGTLYFSNNKRKFRLDPDLHSKYHIKDFSAKSIPLDFRDQKIHHCFKIKALK